MSRGSLRGLVRVARAGGAAAAPVLVALLCSACAFPGSSRRVDRAALAAPPASWSRIAVLPFDGAPELRRPAEELLALRIRHQRRIAVVPPFVCGRALAAARGPGQALPDPAAWIAGRADAEAPLAPAAGATAEEIRAVAARLGVDGVVAAEVTHDATWLLPHASGAAIEVVLFDAAGAPRAVLRRRGSSDATRVGLHEAAMDATGRAADDLLRLLRTPPGEVPAIPAAAEPTPGE